MGDVTVVTIPLPADSPPRPGSELRLRLKTWAMLCSPDIRRVGAGEGIAAVLCGDETDMEKFASKVRKYEGGVCQL